MNQMNTDHDTLMKNMNLLEAVVNIQGFILFAQVFLHVNQHNPVRHLFLAIYTYIFYLYLTMHKQRADSLSMHDHCPVSDLEQRNYTHGDFM